MFPPALPSGSELHSLCFTKSSTRDTKSEPQSHTRVRFSSGTGETQPALKSNQPRGNEVEIGIIVQQELNTSVHDVTSLAQL